MDETDYRIELDAMETEAEHFARSIPTGDAWA